jgi:hypothetical protein
MTHYKYNKYKSKYLDLLKMHGGDIPTDPEECRKRIIRYYYILRKFYLYDMFSLYNNKKEKIVARHHTLAICQVLHNPDLKYNFHTYIDKPKGIKYNIVLISETSSTLIFLSIAERGTSFLKITPEAERTAELPYEATNPIDRPYPTSKISPEEYIAEYKTKLNDPWLNAANYRIQNESKSLNEWISNFEKFCDEIKNVDSSNRKRYNNIEHKDPLGNILYYVILICEYPITYIIIDKTNNICLFIRLKNIKEKINRYLLSRTLTNFDINIQNPETQEIETYNFEENKTYYFDTIENKIVVSKQYIDDIPVEKFTESSIFTSTIPRYTKFKIENCHYKTVIPVIVKHEGISYGDHKYMVFTYIYDINELIPIYYPIREYNYEDLSRPIYVEELQGLQGLPRYTDANIPITKKIYGGTYYTITNPDLINKGILIYNYNTNKLYYDNKYKLIDEVIDLTEQIPRFTKHIAVDSFTIVLRHNYEINKGQIYYYDHLNKKIIFGDNTGHEKMSDPFIHIINADELIPNNLL